MICFSVDPAELLALQVYCPSPVLLILLNVSIADFFPELFVRPFIVTHFTSGSGVPVAEQVMVTEDPSL